MAAPDRRAPPRPVPKPGQVKVVKALYRYIAQQSDELSFEEGDVLYIVDQVTDRNWWKATCNGKTGLIPSNYVEENIEEIFHPLHEASRRGNLSFLKECISNKVSVNGLDKAGCTALHWASRAGNEDCVSELLSVPNVELNVKNKIGDTPLHLAASKGHIAIVKMLVNKGARVNIVNNESQTPLMMTKDTGTAAYLESFQRISTTSVEDYGDSDESE